MVPVTSVCSLSTVGTPLPGTMDRVFGIVIIGATCAGLSSPPPYLPYEEDKDSQWYGDSGENPPLRRDGQDGFAIYVCTGFEKDHTENCLEEFSQSLLQAKRI